MCIEDMLKSHISAFNKQIETIESELSDLRNYTGNDFINDLISSREKLHKTISDERKEMKAQLKEMESSPELWAEINKYMPR